MSLARTLWFAALLLPAVPAGGGAPGAQLRQGMELRYESGGAAQPPWTVDSLVLGATLRPGMECAVVRLRRNPDRPPDESRLCVGHDTLYRYEPTAGDWAISRPVGPGMVWETRQPGGDRVRYETGARAEETISGLVIAVVPTTILTTDSLGAPKRRLRERYALSLTTATGGVFEVPDSAAAGGWRASQAFELREIRRHRSR